VAKHIAVLALIATFLLNRVLNWFFDEVKAWIPWCASRFFDVSVRLLPPDERERYSEEWRRHIESLPGIGLASAQFIVAAFRIRTFLMMDNFLQWWMQFRMRSALIVMFAYWWLNAQATRVVGTRKPVAGKHPVENPNLVVAVVVILVAFLLMERSPDPQPTGIA
jgi:hypothetical protein